MLFSVKTFDELSAAELFQIYRLRAEVFVVEQNCVYQDVDEYDLSALHVQMRSGSELAGYCRIVRKTDSVSIGRVVVRQTDRNQGFGIQLIKYSIKHAVDSYRPSAIVISAQRYLTKFYNGLGFVAEGAGYDEDGIPHIKMRLPIDQDAS